MEGDLHLLVDTIADGVKTTSHDLVRRWRLYVSLHLKRARLDLRKRIRSLRTRAIHVAGGFGLRLSRLGGSWIGWMRR